MEDIFKPKLHFDNKKPFYPLVIAYLAQVHGLLELLSRGIKIAFGEKFNNIDIQQLIHPPNGLNPMLQKDAIKLKKLILGNLTELIGDQELASNVDKGIRIDIEALANGIVNHQNKGQVDDPVEYYNRMTAGGLLINTWEFSKKYHSNNELWRFFKHCRNAAAHGGTFHFKPGEPKVPAKWRTLEIKATLQGKPLFTTPIKDGFIGPGDVLYLLADIEATLMS